MVRITALGVVLGATLVAGTTVVGDFVVSVAKGLIALNMAGCAGVDGDFLVGVSGGVAAFAVDGAFVGVGVVAATLAFGVVVVLVVDGPVLFFTGVAAK